MPISGENLSIAERDLRMDNSIMRLEIQLKQIDFARLAQLIAGAKHLPAVTGGGATIDQVVGTVDPFSVVRAYAFSRRPKHRFQLTLSASNP